MYRKKNPNIRDTKVTIVDDVNLDEITDELERTLAELETKVEKEERPFKKIMRLFPKLFKFED